MKVLLARPNDFIVDDMTRWVKQLGFTPLPLSEVSELLQTPSSEVVGIVISTAVTSRVKATFGQVLDAARDAHPTAPLVFSSLSSLPSTLTGISAELTRHRLTLQGPDDSVAWGPNVALFVSPTDLKGPRSEALSAAARRHFRR